MAEPNDYITATRKKFVSNDNEGRMVKKCIVEIQGTFLVNYSNVLDFFKDFENEFPTVVYNDALTSKSDFLTEYIEQYGDLAETMIWYMLKNDNALSPGYVANSDPEEDPEEDLEEDPAEYPIDGGNDDDDDDDDDKDDEEEEEEHLAPTDSTALHIVDLVSSAEDIEEFKTD
ncbi:hypothetical protein Tco_0699745 [Tanacetum coccineum]